MIDKLLAEARGEIGYKENETVGLSGPLKTGVVHGLRHQSEPGKTGWYVWQGELKQDPDFFKPMHAFHITDELPELQKYLQLPPGYRFLIDTTNGYEDIWFDEQLLSE